MLNVIDIASHQKGIVPSRTNADAVIVKVTGGISYVNGHPVEPEDNWRIWADDVLRSGKLLGLYHYAWEQGRHGSAAQEAAFFLSKVKDYKGKFIPILDWEDEAQSLPASWAREWLDIVAKETGATPMFYGGANDVNHKDYSLISKYPLWMASYLFRYEGCGFVADPVNVWSTGDWPSMKMYQYTSTGYIEGYSENLDLSVFYGTRAEWEAMCGKKPEQVAGKAKNDAGLKYHVHAQDVGDLAVVHDGQTAGTVGFSKRMEALTFDAIPKGFKLRCKLHLEGIGWRSYDVVPGKLLGTKGESRRVECVGFEVLERPEGDKRKLHFQVHQQDYGWLADTKEGYFSGCDGQSRRLEAVRIWLA